MMSVTVGRAGAWVMLVTLVVAGGCAKSIPDVRPFRDGTVTLRNATGASFNETIGAAKDIESQMAKVDDLKEDSEDYAKSVAYLTELQKTRMAVLDGMVNYANALNRTATFGQAKIERAQSISAATKKMIDDVSAAAGGVVATGPGADLVKEGIGLFADAATRAYSAYQTAQTNKELLGQIEGNQEAVDTLVTALEQDLTKLAARLRLMARPADVLIRSEPSAAVLYRQRKQLVAKRVADTGPSSDEKMDKAVALEQQIAVIEGALAPIDQARVAAARRFELAVNVVTSAKETLGAWKASHDDLRDAVAQNNVLDASELQGAVEELKAEVKRFKDYADKVEEMRKSK